MLALNSHIEITHVETGEYLELSHINNVEIEQSKNNLTTTCKITIPRKIKIFNSNKGVYQDINTIIKRGAKVIVKLGYEPELRTEFTGYVTRLGAGIPLEIFCENEMWQLKQNSITKAYKNVSLKTLVSDIYTGIARVADLNLGGFVIKAQTTAQVLASLKKFSLQCYFDVSGVLVVDFANSTNNNMTRVMYDFNKNIIDDDLEFTRKEDIRVRCKGISRLPTGKKIEFIHGDKDGDLRTLNYYNIEQSELEKIVKNELDKLKRDGLKNGFNTFGQPYCDTECIAVLNDIELPERNGSYVVQAVKTTFGVNGFRRNITIGKRLA